MGYRGGLKRRVVEAGYRGGLKRCSTSNKETDAETCVNILSCCSLLQVKHSFDPVCPTVGWSAGRFVGLSVRIFQKGGKFHVHACSYWSTCNIIELSFLLITNIAFFIIIPFKRNAKSNDCFLPPDYPFVCTSSVRWMRIRLCLRALRIYIRIIYRCAI